MGFGDISTNMVAFNRTVNKFAALYDEKKIRVLVKKLSFDIWKAISASCPVKTGRARANFQLDTRVNNGTVATFNSISGPPPPRLEDSMVYWIFNNLDYIQALEDGHSQQARGGFIAPAIREFNRVYEKRARQMGLIK